MLLTDWTPWYSHAAIVKGIDTIAALKAVLNVHILHTSLGLRSRNTTLDHIRNDNDKPLIGLYRDVWIAAIA